MNTATRPDEESRRYSPVEFGVFVRLSREMRDWTEEDLAKQMDMSVDDVLRLEEGHPTEPVVQERVAKLLGVEDLDELRVPLSLDHAFHRDAHTYVQVQALPVESGLHLAALVESCDLVLVTPSFPMPEPLGARFNDFAEKVTRYLETHAQAEGSQREACAQAFDADIAQMQSQGISLRYGKRSVASLTRTGVKADALYVVGYISGFEPESFMTPRRIRAAT